MLKVQTKTGVLILQKWLKNKQLRIISKGQEHPPMHQYLCILNWKDIDSLMEFSVCVYSLL